MILILKGLMVRNMRKQMGSCNKPMIRQGLPTKPTNNCRNQQPYAQSWQRTAGQPKHVQYDQTYCIQWLSKCVCRVVSRNH